MLCDCMVGWKGRRGSSDKCAIWIHGSIRWSYGVINAWVGTASYLLLSVLGYLDGEIIIPRLYRISLFYI